MPTGIVGQNSVYHVKVSTTELLSNIICLRYLGVLDACSGGQSWQAMLSIGMLFAWEGHVFPYLFYQGCHVAYKTSKIAKIHACLIPLT